MDGDFEKIIKQYNNPEVDSQVRILSDKFLNEYWLPNEEMLNFWLPIKNRIFRPDSKDLPDLIFRKDFELIVQRGGILFTKEEYYALQNCMKIAGDKYFVLIENEFVRNTKGGFPHLRFKFPINTTWETLNNGDENYPDISFETLFIMDKHFFVFGDSGKWGKYSAGNYGYTPLDIIGFNPELAPVFQEHFKLPKEEWEEIREWLPPKYKRLIK